MTKRNRVSTECVVCGLTLEVTPYRLKNGRGRYCSKECRNQRLKEIGGIPNAKQFTKGIKPVNFRGWAFTEQGYKLIFKPEHPNCTTSGYVREHRLVIEDYLDRYLDATEEVHHVDHDKLNNDIGNLMVLSKSEHAKLHAQERRNYVPSPSIVI